MNSNKNFHKRPLSPRVRRHRRKRRLILGGLALLLVLLIVGIAFLIRGCFIRPAGGPDASSSAGMTTAAPETTTAAPETTTQPPLTTATDPVFSMVSGVDDSYFDDACFIGDSRTEAFMLYAGPANATNFASKGLSISKVFSDKTVTLDGQELTVSDALGKKQFGKVYVMLGLNELGWAYPDIFAQRCGDLVDRIRETSPEADIFIQSILPVTAERSAQGDYINNSRILEYNTLLQELCREKQVAYLPVGDAVADADGNLPEDASSDGIHLNKTYCLKWLDYLKTHTDAAAYIPS
ncbi:MAG TPA: hypothetical protein H9694_05990 [Firmicutes bacterium]|nr:hypothetical protein [Bacillota bacterium]